MEIKVQWLCQRARQRANFVLAMRSSFHERDKMAVKYTGDTGGTQLPTLPSRRVLYESRESAHLPLAENRD